MSEAAGYAALSRIALADRPLAETLHEVAVLAKRVLPESPEASVTLVADDQVQTAAFSGELAVSLDERQYDAGYGPCLDASVSGGLVRVTMDDPDGPYPDFRRAAQRYGVTHSLSVGLPAAGRVIGALNLYGSGGQPFTDGSARIAGTFAGFAGLVLSTVGRSDDAVETAHQLQSALESRAVISEAQGILMAQHRCSREQAFALLVRGSREQGLKLQETAQALIDETTSS
jgi:GAF domain-containing protein